MAVKRPLLKAIIFPIICLGLLSSCSTTKPLDFSGMKSWSYPQNQFDKQFSVGYADHVLKKLGQERADKWARRRGIHVLSMKIINNTNKPVRGVQLALENGDEPVEVLSNKWVAKKVRKKMSPFLFFLIPLSGVENTIWKSVYQVDEYPTAMETNPEVPSISEKAIGSIKKKRRKKNKKLESDLEKFQLGIQYFPPGTPVYSIVAIRSRGDLTNLKLKMNGIKLEVLP